MKFKDILPFEEYVIKSQLPIEQIILKLKENIEPKSNSIFSAFSKKTKKLYEGELYGNRFKINRIINYKNSFIPIISGDIFTLKDFTNINIKMETNRTILVIWYLIFLTVGFGMTIFNNIFISLSDKNNLPFGGNEFFILLPLFLVTPILAFKIESRKSKKFLSKLLEETNSDII